MKSHIQVKVASLAAEMKIIHRLEIKWKARARRARKKVNDASYHESNFWTLRHHRNNLKLEARSTHLAYGYMRGRSYSQMEQICYGPLKGYGSTEPNWKAIEEMVERFTKGETSPQDYMQKFAEWLADAKAWYESNPKRIKALNADRPNRIARLQAMKKPYIRVA